MPVVLLPTPVTVPVPAPALSSPDLPSLSLSTRGSKLFARFKLCGPDVVGTSTGTFASALAIMQAVVSLEVDIGISPINLYRLIVGLGFSFVSLMCVLAVASEDAPLP